MHQHVCVEATLPGEGGAAGLALKLLLAIVHQHVCVEAAATGEPLATLVTLKLLLPAMGQPVNVQATLAGEESTTLLTVKLFLPCVGVAVRLEGTLSGEATAALLALEPLLAAVHEAVRLEGTLAGEELGADLAGKPLLADAGHGGSKAGEVLVWQYGHACDGRDALLGVYQHVGAEVSLLGQEGTTLLAGKLLLPAVHDHVRHVVLVGKLFAALLAAEHDLGVWDEHKDLQRWPAGVQNGPVGCVYLQAVLCPCSHAFVSFFVRQNGAHIHSTWHSISGTLVLPCLSTPPLTTGCGCSCVSVRGVLSAQ